MLPIAMFIPSDADETPPPPPMLCAINPAELTPLVNIEELFETATFPEFVELFFLSSAPRDMLDPSVMPV